MWVEANILFANALEDYPGLTDAPADGSAYFLHRPKPPVSAPLGSSVAFPLAKVAGGKSPREIASELMQRLEPASEGLFRFTVEQAGYLNIEFSNEAREQLLCGYPALCGEAGPAFRSALSWKFHGEKMPEPELILDDALIVRQSDAILGDDRLQLRGSEAAVRLMRLGVLADVELDVQTFLRGLPGRENLPWMFGKFVEDLGRAKDALTPDTSVEVAAPVISAFLAALEEHLLWFRFSLAQAARNQKPETHLRSIMETAKTFYSFYNRPDLRLRLESIMPGGQAIRLQRALESIGMVVRSALSGLLRGCR